MTRAPNMKVAMWSEPPVWMLLLSSRNSQQRNSTRSHDSNFNQLNGRCIECEKSRLVVCERFGEHLEMMDGWMEWLKRLIYWSNDVARATAVGQHVCRAEKWINNGNGCVDVYVSAPTWMERETMHSAMNNNKWKLVHVWMKCKQFYLFFATHATKRERNQP